MAEYAFNALTGNLDRVGNGSGPGGDITINGDTGAPIVGTNFNFVGQEAGTVPVMEVDTASGDVAIINNAWQTQYVVDASTTVGLKGTFTTIQAAIDQVVADGGAVIPFHEILIRPGTYSDPVVFPNSVGIILTGCDPADGIGQTYGVNISGSITMAATAYACMQNLLITGSVDTTNGGICTMKNVNAFTVTGSGPATFSSCTVNSGNLSGGCTAWDCTLGLGNFTMSGGAVYSIRRSLCGNILLEGPALVTITGCTFSSAGFIGNTANPYNGFLVVEDTIPGISSSLFSLNGGEISYSNITIPNASSVNSIIGPTFTPNSIRCLPHFGGNIKSITKTATDMSIVARNEMYIGVTDTSSPRTIDLPPSSPTGSAPFIGQEFEIKDETGAASLNNISVTGTIDGISGYTISEDYGSLRVRFDGASYWSIPGPSAVSGGPFLTVANNLSDLASASTARTNLGLGTAAVQNTGFFLQTANNLSDLASAATARSNLGLGSAALINAPIANSDLVNSGITVNVSGGLTGGGNVSLGGSVNIVGPGGGGAYVDGVTGYTDVTGTSQALAVNQGYQANNAGLVTFTLPSNAAVGTIIKIRGYGSGGWTVAQNASQQVILGAKGATTVGTGGSVSSTNRYDKITLFCAVANTTWTAEWDGVLTPV